MRNTIAMRSVTNVSGCSSSFCWMPFSGSSHRWSTSVYPTGTANCTRVLKFLIPATVVPQEAIVKGVSWLCVGKMPINAQVRADDWSDLLIGENYYFNRNVISWSSGETTDFSLVTRKTSPIIGVHTNLHSSAYINTFLRSQNLINNRYIERPTFFSFKNPVQVDVCHNMEEKICHYFHFIAG